MARINDIEVKPCYKCGFDGDLIFGLEWDCEPICCPICESIASDFKELSEQILYWNKKYEELNCPPLESSQQTYLHKKEVNKLINKVTNDLRINGNKHDQSKLEEPELSVFDEFTSKLKNSTYGSEQYNQFLRDMKPALDHHYKNNPHHPEYYGDAPQGKPWGF